MNYENYLNKFIYNKYIYKIINNIYTYLFYELIFANDSYLFIYIIIITIIYNLYKCLYYIITQC